MQLLLQADAVVRGDCSVPACPAQKPSPLLQASSNAVVYNASRQHKNPVLKHIINLSVLPADIVPDFQLGQQACVLFLSLK